jgi:hypothetical protein
MRLFQSITSSMSGLTARSAMRLRFASVGCFCCDGSLLDSYTYEILTVPVT